MSVSASRSLTEERDRYPLHEEDDVPEKPRHERQNGYLRPALRARFPGWFVTGNVCIYWEPDNYEDYAAPDVFVVRDWQPLDDPSVYLTWADPPVVFVAEVFAASQSATYQSQKTKEYETLVQAREFLSYRQDRGELKLRRLGPSGYEEVLPEPNGRVRSQELQLEFGVDADGFLWVYTLEGERLQTYEELDQRVEELDQRVTDELERRATAEARAASEARRRETAERRATLERQRRELMARQRQNAEARAAEEAYHRQNAEARAAEEARQREAAEARAVELERELAALRARLQDGGE